MNARVLLAATVIAFALAGCSGDEPSPEEEPVQPDPVASDESIGDCLTGGPWFLNLPDYAAQAESYMTDLGIPITNFEMTGQQTVQFTDDGLMSVETDITSSGILVVPDVGEIPIAVPSQLGGSGEWSEDGDGVGITIQRWQALTPDGVAEPTDPAADVPVPVLDFSTIPNVAVTCQPGLLTLVAPESPFVPLFTR